MRARTRGRQERYPVAACKEASLGGGQVPNPHLRVSIHLHSAPKEPHLPHTRPGPGTRHFTSIVSGHLDGGPLCPRHTDKETKASDVIRSPLRWAPCLPCLS